MKKGLLCALVWLTAALTPLMAQFDGLWTQYMFHPGLYNVAGINPDNELDVHLSLREQWTAMTNSPSTFALEATYPIRMGKRVDAIGLVLINESIGLFTTQWLQAQYSARFSLWGGTLCAGLQGGILQENFDAGGIYIPSSDYHNTNDASIPKGEVEGLIPDFSLGLWYRWKRLNVGLSCSHLTGSKIKLKSQGSAGSEAEDTRMKVARTIYFTGSYNIPFKNPLFSLQPSVLVMSDLVAVQANLSAVFDYKKLVWGGLNWRPGADFGFMAGIHLGFGLSLGYSYDLSTRQTSGSHEISIGYHHKINTTKINKQQKSIRLL